MRYSNCISDYRVVRVGEYKRVDDFGGYQPDNCKYFIEMKTKVGIMRWNKWVRLHQSYTSKEDAIVWINSRAYDKVKDVETVVWEGDTGERR